MGKIVSYQGSMDKLVWHKELRGLNGDSEVVVPVAHEAVFILGDTIVDSFSMGRYFLGESSAFCKLFEQNKTVDATVYYIKKEGTYNVKWAIEEPLRLDDPVLKLPVELDIEGVFAIKIIDARDFLLKQIENAPRPSLEEVKAFFRNRMLLHIKDQLLLVLKEAPMSIVEAINKPVSVSKALEFKMRYLFSEFGVSVESLMLKKLSLVNAFAAKSDELKECCCPSCAQALPQNAKFCFACGQKQEA